VGNVRPAGLQIAIGLVAVTLATRTGMEDELGPARATTAWPLVGVASAALDDRDASGTASAGDVVVLGLRRPLAPGRAPEAGDVLLVQAAEHWGRDAHLLAHAPDERELRLVLGQEPALRLYGTYAPGAVGRSVAQIRSSKGPVPVLVQAGQRRAFVGDAFPDSPGLRAFKGQLHAHTGFSDGELAPADAFAAARGWGLHFFAVTDHLEQLTADEWRQGRAAADAAEAPGAFVALYGFELGGFPTLRGWMNHVNVVGTDRLPGVWSTVGLNRLYDGILRLPGPDVVAQFNHPGMQKHVLGRNNWNDFAYDARADLRMKLVTVETRSATRENHREEVGYVPALEHGWHVGPKAEEDNHRADWARSPRRTGVWLPELTRAHLLAGLTRMATFYTDDPNASLKLSADGQWLMGSTLHGPGPHALEVTVEHTTRSALVTRAELVGPGGVVIPGEANARTPFHVRFEVDPEGDAYYFARVTLEDADTRLLSAPIFFDR
jgi:hypothetical protein